jgi:voltage-gated potassium channel
MLEKLRSRINFYFVDIETAPGRAVDIAVVALIVIVSIIFVIKTYQIPRELLLILNQIENIIIGIFVIEYILRIWSAPNRIRQIFSIYSIVDLIAIIPFFFVAESYQILRIFRALRVLRLIRFLEGRHFFYRRFTRTHIIVIRIVFIIFAIIFVSSGMIFYAEHKHPGTKIATFSDSVYFAIITLTTVGYGDITPVTGFGRFITILIVLSGIIFIPWQIKELIKQFIIPGEKISTECRTCGLEHHEADAKFCKNCGTQLEGRDLKS